MNWNLFIIDVLINNLHIVPTLIDGKCDCLAAVSNSLARKANLQRIDVALRKLTEATRSSKSGKTIKVMTKMEIYIDSYQRSLNAYIIPRLSHELILGKPWIEQEDVIYRVRDRCMEIREAQVGGQPLRVRERRGHETEGMTMKLTANIMCLSAGVFVATVRRARKVNN